MMDNHHFEDSSSSSEDEEEETLLGGTIVVDLESPEFTSILENHRRRFNTVVQAILFEEEEEEVREQDGEQRPGHHAGPKKRRKRGVIWYRDEEGNLSVLPPTKSLWYSLYCCGEDVGVERQPNFHKKFRNRFRMPYPQYLELLELCRADASAGGPLNRWRHDRPSNRGTPPAPIQLLILASLRYLGRGWTFDDVEEATAISRDVLRKFHHAFIEFGATVLFPQWVRGPETLEEARAISYEFTLAGFPGCIGSMDASHIQSERISYRIRQSHLAHKMPFTARTYNIITNHRRRILSTTTGHPARWNDKTLVTFDGLACTLNEGSNFLKDLRFELYQYDEANNVVIQKYSGAWLLVDNGYLNWAVTVPPMKDTNTMSQWRFSKWLESMRKDVECTFGILKGRWRVLKAGVRLHGTKACDYTWMTCCALHNWLLEVDGLDEEWGSVWEGSHGELGMPEAVRRLLHAPIDGTRNYDSSGAGFGNDAIIDNQPAPEVDCVIEKTDDGSILVHKMNMREFRKKLITHFAIAFAKKEVAWPQARMRRDPPDSTN